MRLPKILCYIFSYVPIIKSCQLDNFIFLNPPFFCPIWSLLSNWMIELGPNQIFMACSRKRKERKAEHHQVLGVTLFQNNKLVKCMRMNASISPVCSTMGLDKDVIYKTVRFHRHLKSTNCSNFL